MKPADYWKKRAENDMLAAERSSLEYELRLADAYAVALSEITKSLDAFYNKYAKDNKVSYDEARRRLTPEQRRTYNALLKEWYRVAQEAGIEGSYSEYLHRLGKQAYVTRLEALQSEMRNQIELLKNNQFTWMTELISDNYIFGYYASFYTIVKGVDLSVNFATVDKLGLEKAVRTRWDKNNYSDRIWADRDKLVATLERIIPRSFSMGQRSTELGKMIANELGVSKNKGITLARTEVNFICNQSCLDSYKIAGIAEYEYLATLDMRTSEICRGLDGSIFKTAQAEVGINYPPMHPRCRSTTIAHFKDDDTLDRIARNKDGDNIKVPRRMSQDEWINTYAPEADRPRLLSFLKKYRTE